MLSDAAKARAINRGPGFLGFLLAHHFPGHLDRCYLVWLGDKPLWFCARCLGLYPIMILVVLAQFLWPIPASNWDYVWLFGLPLPALFDWGRARLLGQSGNNLGRTITGAVLGVSLARTIFINAITPLDRLIIVQLAGLTGLVVLIELAAYLRSR